MRVRYRPHRRPHTRQTSNTCTTFQSSALLITERVAAFDQRMATRPRTISLKAYNYHAIGFARRLHIKTQMTQKVAAQFKKLLLARREDITRRLIQPEEVPAPILSDDPLDVTPAPLKAPSLDAHSQALLMEMDAALARIENGTYGECISCGKEIGTKRLVAFPCTRYCLACKSTTKPA